jgi:hypothetical protein
MCEVPKRNRVYRGRLGYDRGLHTTASNHLRNETGSTQCWKRFMDKMEAKGFQRTHAEPCLLKRKDQDGTVIVHVSVDDCLLTGDRKTIDAALVDIESELETRRLGGLKEYVRCTFVNLPDGTIKMIQPDMIRKLENVFGIDIVHMRHIHTPFGPGETVERSIDNDEKLELHDQTSYRSGVGMLLYLVKHSRHDLSNAVKELPKVMDGATEEQEKMLHRVIKIYFDTKERGISIRPDIEKGVTAYVDSDGNSPWSNLYCQVILNYTQLQ